MSDHVRSVRAPDDASTFGTHEGARRARVGAAGSGRLPDSSGRALGVAPASARIASIDVHQLSVVTSDSPLPSSRKSISNPRLPDARA